MSLSRSHPLRAAGLIAAVLAACALAAAVISWRSGPASAPARSSTPTPAPRLPQADELHWVGILRGRTPRGWRVGRPAGLASVIIDRPGKSVNLIVSAEEQVSWKVTLRHGRLASLVATGFEPQLVHGNALADCPVVLLSSAQDPGPFLPFLACPDRAGSREECEARLQALTRQRLNTFQGHTTATADAYFIRSSH